MPDFEPAKHFDCLAKLEVLECLRVGLPFLMTRFPEEDAPCKTFWKMLPGRLATVEIVDYYCHHLYARVADGPFIDSIQYEMWPAMEKGESQPPFEPGMYGSHGAKIGWQQAA